MHESMIDNNTRGGVAMDFIRQNFGIIFIGIGLFNHFRYFVQYKDDVELKNHFYISSIIGVILWGLVIIDRFTTVISVNTMIILLVIGAILITYFEWPMFKEYRNQG